MSSTGVSSSSTEGAVADRFVGGESARFAGRARLAWTAKEERAAGLFITALLYSLCFALLSWTRRI